MTLYFPIINRDSSTEKETTDDEGIPDVSKQRKQRKYDPEMQDSIRGAEVDKIPVGKDRLVKL